MTKEQLIEILKDIREDLLVVDDAIVKLDSLAEAILLKVEEQINNGSIYGQEKPRKSKKS